VERLKIKRKKIKKAIQVIDNVYLKGVNYHKNTTPMLT